MDLNLVRVFVTIYETGSLTVSGERLFVTQSAVSQALGRMREHFDDPLFTRAGREMRPTPLADALFPALRESLAGIDRALDGIKGFDAAQSDRLFRIALSELGEIGWLPAIFAAMHRVAPLARLQVVPMEGEDVVEWLARGSVDLAVTPLPLSEEFEWRRVKSQRYVVAMSSVHPLATGALTLNRYVDAHHVDVESDSGATLLRSAQRAAGLSIRPILAVQHFATLAPLLASSADVVATMPESIAEGWAPDWPIVTKELPFPMAEIELNLYRRRTAQQTAALNWFYETVAQAIEGSAGEFSIIRGSSEGT